MKLFGKNEEQKHLEKIELGSCIFKKLKNKKRLNRRLCH